MVDVCSIDLMAEHGIDDVDALRIKNVLDKYFAATGANRSTHGVLRLKMVDIVEKLKTDAETTSLAVQGTHILTEELKVATGNPAIQPSDVKLAQLLSVFGNRVLNMLGKTLKDVPPTVLELGKHLRHMNLNTLKDNIAAQMSGRDSLVLNKIALQVQFPEQFRTGLYQGRMLEFGKYGNNIDAIFMHTQHHPMMKNITDELMKPDANGVYQPLDLNKADKLVDEINEALGITSALGEEAIINKKLTVGYLKQMNSFLIEHQKRGVSIQWNKNYVLPNDHSQIELVHNIAATHIAKVVNDPEYKGDRIALDEALKEAKAKAMSEWVDLISPLLDDELTMGKDWVARTTSDPDKYGQYKQAKLEGIFDTLYNTVVRDYIQGELDDGEVVAANLNAVTRLLSRRTLYFKDGMSQFHYMMNTSNKFKDAYGFNGKPANPQGTVLIDRLIGSIDSNAKDLVLLQVLGSNPRQTMNRLKVETDVPTGKGLDTRIKQKSGDVVMQLLNTVGQMTDNKSLKQYIFPVNNSPLLNVTDDLLDSLKSLNKDSLFKHTEIGRDLSPLMATGVNPTIDTSLNNTLWEKSFAGLALFGGISKAALDPALFMANTILDLPTQGYRLAEMKMNTWAALETGSNVFKSAVTMMEFIGGKMLGKDVETRLGDFAARALNISKSDLTIENTADVFGMLGQTKNLLSFIDKTNFLNGRKGSTNKAVQWLNQFTASVQNHQLGGLASTNMADIQMFNSALNMVNVHQLITRLTDPKSKVSPYLELALSDHGLSRSDLNALDKIYGKPISNGRYELIETGTLDAPFEGKYTEEQYINDFDPDGASKIDVLENKVLESQMIEHNRTLRDKYDTDVATHGADGIAKPVTFNNVLDFKALLPEKYVEQNKDLRTQLATRLLEYKARKVASVCTDLADDIANRLVSNEWFSVMQKSSTPSDRIVNASFFYLKSFIAQYTERLARDVEAAHRLGGGGKVVERLAAQTILYTSVGMLYATIQGAVSNKQEGYLGLAADLTDETLTDEQKLGYSLGHIAQGMSMGLPIGSYLRTGTFFSSGAKDAWDVVFDITAAPQLSTYLKTADSLRNVVNKTVKEAEGDTTEAQDESSAKLKFETAMLGVRQIPVMNMIAPKILMNYAIEPAAREMFGVISKAEQAQNRKDRVDTEGFGGAFFNDPNTPIFQPSE